MEQISFEAVDINGKVRVENNFSFAVNEEDYSKIKVNGEITLSDDSSEENSFLSIVYTGYFDSNNTKESLSMDDISNPIEFFNYLMPDLSETISFITRKAFGEPLELPVKIPTDLYNEESEDNDD